MGLDIGTTKVCAIVGEIQSDGAVNIIGVGSAPSRGSKEVVVNIDSTVASIRQAVDEAQQMAGVDISLHTLVSQADILWGSIVRALSR